MELSCLGQEVPRGPHGDRQPSSRDFFSALPRSTFLSPCTWPANPVDARLSATPFPNIALLLSPSVIRLTASHRCLQSSPLAECGANLPLNRSLPWTWTLGLWAPRPSMHPEADPWADPSDSPTRSTPPPDPQCYNSALVSGRGRTGSQFAHR